MLVHEQRLSERLNKLLEALAALEHERWSHWQRYVHGKCVPVGNDGALLIPGDLVRHWESQMQTHYSQLTETEKESDREQVRKYLPLIIDILQEVSNSAPAISNPVGE